LHREDPEEILHVPRTALQLLALLTVLFMTAWVALNAGRYVGARHFPTNLASPLDEPGTAGVAMKTSASI
jgi:hypothetical protein